MQTQCPHCNKECDFPDDMRNLPVECPWCGKSFLVGQVVGTKISDDLAEQSKHPHSGVANNTKKVQYRVFRGIWTSFEELFSQAANFASLLGPERLISISHCETTKGTVVTVWYWAD